LVAHLPGDGTPRGADPPDERCFASSRNFTIHFLDVMANPYFALAAILGEALKGIQEKAVLRVKDCTGLAT